MACRKPSSGTDGTVARRHRRCPFRRAARAAAHPGLGRSAYGTHSLRRTKVALIYKRAGNLRAVRILLGRSKLESTVRYLGVEAEDALTLSEATEI